MKEKIFTVIYYGKDGSEKKFHTIAKDVSHAERKFFDYSNQGSGTIKKISVHCSKCGKGV
jgi:hypothetical protein